MSKPKKLERDALIKKLKALPEGTREAVAYADCGEGYSRNEFRDLWLTERLGVTVGPKEYNKAVIDDGA